MRTPLLGAAAATMLLGASLSFGAAAIAQPALLTSGVYQASDAPTLQPAQFFFGGQNYCWYDGGWQGPGYYYCGYAWRRGLGWGGGAGWNGWHGGGNGGGHAGGYRSGGAHGGASGGAMHAAGGSRSSGGHAGGGHAGGGHAGGGHAGGGHAGGGHAGGGHAGGGQHH
jgi:hypothetical protein